MTEWTTDKRWADRFIPEIKTILGAHLISEGPCADDAERATDLIVLTLRPFRIGCRIRRYEYMERYPDEFTIRAGRPSGVKTELAKVIEGWGDFFFYGFADQDAQSLRAWRLCDLSVFRLWLNRCLLTTGKMPGVRQENPDGSSEFYAFRVSSLPSRFIVAEHGC